MCLEAETLVCRGVDRHIDEVVRHVSCRVVVSMLSSLFFMRSFGRRGYWWSSSW